MPADNTIYNTHAEGWWNQNNFLHLLKTGINPVRFEYFKNVIIQNKMNPGILNVLDIGCGGGFLSEEFARLGSSVIGIDLSTTSLRCAYEHSHLEKLKIDYLAGAGEILPFSSSSFDIAICCDVLEHVDNLNEAVKEASRVLKPGGLFLFDTINRTPVSYFETILVGQVLPFTRFFAPDTHDWHQFIKPVELTNCCNNHNLRINTLRGFAPGLSKFQTAVEIIRLRLGRLNFAELGHRLRFQETHSISGSYMGYAVKNQE